MAKRGGAVHVATTRRHYKDKVYETTLLRRSYREGGKVKTETLANLSHLPAETIELVRESLAGKTHVEAGSGFEIERSLPHGHVAAVWAMADKVGLAKLLGPACAERDLTLALVVARAVRPASKLATTRWWTSTTLAADLGVAGASTDDVYAAMDWLVERQADIEGALARRHLSGGGRVLYDLSSSWVEGRCCPLAARGYSRDGKKGKAQIEYGLLTDPHGRPVAVRVFPGNTADPQSFTEAVTVVREKFGLEQMVMAGDRGMITAARIDALRELQGAGWLTALRAPAIKKLAEDGGPLQLSLSGQQYLAEITSPDYPGERLIVCRNPLQAAERTRKREDLLAATENLLAPIAARVRAAKLAGASEIGVAAGKVIGKYKMAKHFDVEITDTSLAITRKQDQIDAEAALDGFYVLRTSIPADHLDAPGVVTAYKNLAYLERDFRHIKADDPGLRPIYHHLEERVKAHVLICMLACYLTWHLRRAWAPLTFTDEEPPAPANPVAPARRSARAHAKASAQHDELGHPYRSF